VRGPYHMATSGMSAREREAWFRNNWIPAESHDPAVPSRFMCAGAQEESRQLRTRIDRDGRFQDVQYGEWYNQAGTSRTGISKLNADIRKVLSSEESTDSMMWARQRKMN
jgi:hypothetical protein